MVMSLSELRELVMGSEAWYAAVHGVTKSDWVTELNQMCQVWKGKVLKDVGSYRNNEEQTNNEVKDMLQEWNFLELWK